MFKLWKGKNNVSDTCIRFLALHQRIGQIKLKDHTPLHGEQITAWNPLFSGTLFKSLDPQLRQGAFTL